MFSMPAIIATFVITRLTMTLIEFEAHTNLTAKQAATLLGMPAPTYYQYRREDRMPELVIRFVDVIACLSESQLDQLIRKYVNGIA